MNACSAMQCLLVSAEDVEDVEDMEDGILSEKARALLLLCCSRLLSR
jgi:hypothetical protein